MSDTPQTQTSAEVQSVTVDDLSKKIQDTTKELDQLKNGLNVYSIEEQDRRLSEIEESILDCTQDLQQLETEASSNPDKDELKNLKSKIDALKSSKDQLKQQIQKETKTAMDALSQEVAQSQSQDGSEKSEEKKETGKKILRVLGGVGIVAGTVALCKRIFGGGDWESKIPGYDKMSRKEKRQARRKRKRENRKERRENRPWRQKFLIGAGIATGAVVGGVQIYKHWNKISAWFKEKLGLALSFDEAKDKVEAEIRNGMIKDDKFGAMNAHFEGINYDENTNELSSYGEKTKIDKKNKKIDGLDVEFPSNEELIHAANIVNFAKRKLKGRGATATPFGQTQWGGDIAFNCSEKGSQEFLSASNSNEWTWILGIGGAVGGGLLGGYCAGVKGCLTGIVSGGGAGYVAGSIIDNTSAVGRACGTISRGKNFDLFIGYLNSQKDGNGKSLREAAGEQHIDPNDTPINPIIDNGKEGSEWAGILAEIENTYGEDQSGRRNLEIVWSEDKPNDYIIKSYCHDCKITIEGLPTKKGEKPDYSKITKIHIEKYKDKDWGDGLDIDFPKTEEGLKEAIRIANLTNMIREDRAGKGGEEYPFDYGKYKSPFSLEIDAEGMGTNYMGGTTILNYDTLKTKFPTLHKDLTEFPTTASAFQLTKTFQKKMHNQAKQDESTGSQYIKFLHQMRSSNGGQFWKKA